MSGWSRLVLVAPLLAACAGAPIYPPRPVSLRGALPVDPAPSKVVVHLSVTAAGLASELERVLPKDGKGVVKILGGERPYGWTRGPLTVRAEGDRVSVSAELLAELALPVIGVQRFPLALVARALPMVTSDYLVRLGDASVSVTSTDVRLRAAQDVGGALDSLRAQIGKTIDNYSFDLKPLVTEAWSRIARPIALPSSVMGGADGCARLRVTAIEMGPLLLAGGMEEDVAFTVEPSVTLPCAMPVNALADRLPPLAHVASLPTGAFTVTVPIAARYDELTRALSLAFTDGKLYFSRQFPKLYLDQPEVYAAGDQMVLALRLAGSVEAGLHLDLGGNIYFVGHPQVVDGELRVPDLTPTIETSSFLLRVKLAMDGDKIRDQAKEALKLDLASRFAPVRARLSTELGFAEGAACLRSDVARIEVTGIHTHPEYLRVHLAATAQASVDLPCPR